MAIVDLSQLAAPDVVIELGFETILSERKAKGNPRCANCAKKLRKKLRSAQTEKCAEELIAEDDLTARQSLFSLNILKIVMSRSPLSGRDIASGMLTKLDLSY